MPPLRTSVAGLPQSSLRLFALAVAIPTALSAQTPITLKSSGPSSNRVDILVVSEGFTAGQLPQFASHVAALLADAFSTKEPVIEYANFFNVHRLDLPSVDSGVGPGKNTPFHVFFNSSGYPTIDDSGDAQAVVAEFVPPDMADIILIYINANTNRATAGGGVTVAPAGNDRVNLFLHEVIGHEVGFLADEYIRFPASEPGCSNPIFPLASVPNVQRLTTAENSKWAEWIDEGTPIPTMTNQNDVPGLYEGAECPTDFYRPTFNSIMRNVNRNFDSPQRQHAVRGIYRYMSPIESVMPATATFRLWNTESATLSVSLLAPATHSIQSTFFGSGINVAGTSVVVRGPASNAPGGHTLTIGSRQVTAFAQDLTPWVRSDPEGMLFDSSIWTLDVACPGDCNRDATVSTSEQATGRSIALGTTLLSSCDLADRDGDGRVNVGDLFQASLYQCGFGCGTKCPFGSATTNGAAGFVLDPSMGTPINNVSFGGVPGQLFDLGLALMAEDVELIQFDVLYDSSVIELSGSNPCIVTEGNVSHQLSTFVAPATAPFKRLRIILGDYTAPYTAIGPVGGFVARCAFQINGNAVPGTQTTLSATNAEAIDGTGAPLAAQLFTVVGIPTVTVCGGCGCS